MTYKKLKSMLKLELKTLAKEIRLKKSERKQCENGYVHGLYPTKQKCRIKHLSYCLLNGTPYCKIESKHRDTNVAKDCKREADVLVQEYKELLCEEAIRNSA